MVNFHKVTLLASIIFLLPFNLIQARNMNQNCSLTVIVGSMCSGKTEALIAAASKFVIANPDLIGIFKPCLDNRVLANNEKDPSIYITSRNGSSIKCIAVNDVAEMKKIVLEKNYAVVAIDEAQFFNKEELILFVHDMLALHKKIIVSGLDLDFRSETFGAMGDLLALADEVIKLTAICTECGSDTYCITQRVIDGKPAHYNDPIIMVGDIEYKPRCRNCHIIRKD
ncbi:thymidine kinase [Candidatus Chromulinivorax destructor]|uniref:Thymidine kinase n=1 Tax=Candidatus Chromulinivorax destructor TaxID=2066483 RepID=A0A345ZB48_9BACT|nr:thymidine kinase [Candidatus Chromulinivorax destructor]AXK60515.1 thymidine kinase [Candidatus Chromulinivorax destructor]